MVQGRLFTGSQENSPEGVGGVINPVLALYIIFIVWSLLGGM